MIDRILAHINCALVDLEYRIRDIANQHQFKQLGVPEGDYLSLYREYLCKQVANIQHPSLCLVHFFEKLDGASEVSSVLYGYVFTDWVGGDKNAGRTGATYLPGDVKIDNLVLPTSNHILKQSLHRVVWVTE